MKRNETEKRTISISTDDGYRSVAQLNGKGTATGKENKHWKRQRTFAKLKCKIKKKNIQPTTIFAKQNQKITQNNNWAPSKIRLRLGAEVDKNYNKSNQKKNTIFSIQDNSTGTCALTTMISSTDKLGKTEKPGYVGPTGAVGPQC